MIRSTFNAVPQDARRRGARVLIAAGTVIAAGLLSACGVVAAFVPPLSVGDPLGVDGRAVTAALTDGALTAQDVAHVDQTRTFDIRDLDENLRGFSLDGFHANAGLAQDVTLAGPAGSAPADYPDTFTVTRAVVEATLSDAVNGSVSFTRDVELDLAFERAECASDGCTYRYAGSETLADALDVELTDRAKLESLVSILILRDPETPNRGSLRVGVEIDADVPLGGFVATFRLTSEGSKIRLGG